ncbi:PAS domain-containing protein [Selenomonas sp.]|uniref:PAS domain-containing protein n=1 Tax=Selenomonas sp. TaxID=2053611 RepID=UPI0039BF97F1
MHQADGRILYANDALVTLFGCKTAEAFRTFSKGKASTLIHPDDKARVKAALAAQSSAKDTTATTRCRIVTQDGTTKHVCIITRQVPDEERGVVSYSVIVEAS